MPPKSYKKYRTAVHTRPKGVKVNVEDPIPGKVYNIYACQECIIRHDIDKERSGFKRMVTVPWRKKKSVEQVCPKHNSLLLIKFKVCPECKTEHWGTHLKSSPTCSNCGIHSESNYKKKKLTYYRRGDFYKISEKDLSDPSRCDCIHRDQCLEVTFHKGNQKGIACKDCPAYVGYSL